MKHVVCLAVGIAAAGCAPQYSYVPTTNATATVSGLAAADYQIPPEAPRGDVRIASFGITEVTPAGQEGQHMHALHLRVVVANNAAAPWTFDTRDQRLDLSGRGPIAPAFASANQGTPPPLVAIPPSGKRTVDLFFLLPADLQNSGEIPEFDALWRVNTDSQVVVERTPFERLVVEPDYDAYGPDGYGEFYGPDYYWGGPYWVNPVFPYAGYGWGGGVYIRRGPHFTRGGHGFHGGGFHGGGFHGGGGGHGGGGHR